MKLFAGMAALALLAACGGNDENALTADENRQLNEAAEMLDASPDSLGAPDDDAVLGNGEAPADTGDVMIAGDAATNAQ